MVVLVDSEVEGDTRSGARGELCRIARLSSSKEDTTDFETSGSLRATSGCLFLRCSWNGTMCPSLHWKSPQYVHRSRYLCSNTRCVLGSCSCVLQMWHSYDGKVSCTGRPERNRDVMNDSTAPYAGPCIMIGFSTRRSRREGSAVVPVVCPPSAGRKAHSMFATCSPATRKRSVPPNPRISPGQCSRSASSSPFDDWVVFMTKFFTRDRNGENWSQT